MSILKKLGRGIEKAAKRVITNPVLNAAASAALPGAAPFLRVAGAATALSGGGGGGSSFVADNQVSAMPGSGFRGSNVSLLPAITGAGRALIPRATGALRGSAGGVAAGAAGAMLYDALGNPVKRAVRRRSKGITARELKSFTRVTGILNKYCKTPAPMRRRNTRSKSCR